MTFFTPYQRKNHRNIGWLSDDHLHACATASRIYYTEMATFISPFQTRAPKYLLEAHYEYNADLIEVKT